MKANSVAIAAFLVVSISVIGLLVSTPVNFNSATITFPNGQVITTDVADNLTEQQLGLSFVESLDENSGLLFIHKSNQMPVYWMKDMNFPIDIIWMKDKIITGFDENLQPENPPSTFYQPDSPVNYALEVNAGFVKRNGLKIGDKLDIKLRKE